MNWNTTKAPTHQERQFHFFFFLVPAAAAFAILYCSGRVSRPIQISWDGKPAHYNSYLVAFFFPATVLRRPLRVREFVRVR